MTTQPDDTLAAPVVIDIAAWLARPAWMQRAACRGVANTLDLFFPSRGESLTEAKAVCRECPVQAECLDYAMINHEAHGVWGGLSERERRRLRRMVAGGGTPGPIVGTIRKPISHGTPGGYVAHRRRGEDACDACRQAHAAYRSERRDAC